MTTTFNAKRFNHGVASMRAYTSSLRVRCWLVWVVLTVPSANVLQVILARVIAKLGPAALQDFLASQSNAFESVLNAYDMTGSELAVRASQLFDKLSDEPDGSVAHKKAVMVSEALTAFRNRFWRGSS